ncbi:phage tail assembly chaperone [Pseudoalteromonas rubra]|uniref:phage tail assembly chaperone n=1 Tax=Pseudoalteromonas rubra TaxID=43658 RepID=UPI002DB78E39|nr:phage tail assembly chaperone [Pseudoalteromonas rubra]MEC4090134.1 phage tail assembly chaperone [Pseudoalteromonas rubra]
MLNKISYNGTDYYGVMEDGFYANERFIAGVPLEAIKSEFRRIDLDTITNNIDSRLSSTDWTQFADAPLTTQQKQEYVEYRKKLVELKQSLHNVTDLASIKLPLAPQI